MKENLFLTFPLYPFLPFPQITAKTPHHYVHANATEKEKRNKRKGTQKSKLRRWGSSPVGAAAAREKKKYLLRW